jgi:phosphoglucomutase
MGDTFTHAHVIAIAHAVADLVKENKPSPTIIIGYDSRAGNSPTLEEGSYTKIATETLLSRGVNVMFCTEPTPTPVISWAIEKYAFDGGLILTASHNPPNYNGIKFNGPDGAPANEAMTEILAQKANLYFKHPSSARMELKPGQLKRNQFSMEFAEALVQKVTSTLGDDPIGLGHARILVDARNGSTAAVWSGLCDMLGLLECNISNATPLPNFGGKQPNPAHPDAVTELREKVLSGNYTMGCSHDPDGDRHFIMDELGRALSPEEVLVIILDQLKEIDADLLSIATTVASSAIVQSAAAYHKLNFYETKVGFKHFTIYLKQARRSKKITLAVESSGGFSSSFHTLEKCGFLPAVLLLYTIAMTGKKLSELLNDIHAKYGDFYFIESALEFPAHKRNKIEQLTQDFNLKKANNVFGLHVEKVIKRDGCKICFGDKQWVLIRLSGTEPVARIYAESTSKDTAELLLLKTKEMLTHV